MSDDYTKINTIFKRAMKDGKPGRIIEGDFSKEEFKNIKLYHISEKVHGTNIKIKYIRTETLHEELFFGGKTDDAVIYWSLLAYLKETFTKEKFKQVWPVPTQEQSLKNIQNGKGSGIPIKVILYGEGYGPKIQEGGGRYRDDASFILFDVRIDGWWLEPKNVKDIAQKLGIDYVPELGIMTMEEAIAIVKEQKPISKIAKDKTYVAEGIVARSYPLVLFRNGEPVIWKLKVKDYK